MSARIETRRVLTCDRCGWAVYSKTARTDEELRTSAAKQDGWTVVNGEDLCGDHIAPGTGAGS